jgi:hypothetical protein
MHFLLMHAWPLGQSSFLEQPDGAGRSTGLQLVSVSGTQPSLQEQIIVLKGRLFTTEQMAVTSQGERAMHGFSHLSLRQAVLSGQSPSTLHSGSGSGTDGDSLGEQETSGFPTQPGGHVHLAIWFCTVHVAEGAHGFSYKHGLTHRFEIHAESWEQSSLILHSTRIHCLYGSPSRPGGHLQAA